MESMVWAMTAAEPQHSDPPRMLHRSFYMRSDDETRLAALVEDLHHQTRRPRHEVLAAVVHTTRQHRAEMRSLTQGAPRGARKGRTVPRVTAEPESVAQFGEKGGTGKSSLTNGLAAVAADRGMRVVVVDVDPRATATDELGVRWGSRR